MAAVDKSRTIGDIALHGGMLDACCQACGRIARLDPAYLPPRIHAMTVGAVRYRCIRCGALGKVTLTRRRSPRNQVLPPNPQRVHDCASACMWCTARRGSSRRRRDHHLGDRVRAHIFLCVLAYYVEWHMREAWRELTFADEDQHAKLTRDPVAPAQRSDAALKKVETHRLPDGSQAHCFHTLLETLATVVRNTCRIPGDTNAATFDVVTTPNRLQRHATDLIDAIGP